VYKVPSAFAGTNRLSPLKRRSAIDEQLFPKLKTAIISIIRYVDPACAFMVTHSKGASS
jgi:hypothetical protein